MTEASRQKDDEFALSTSERIAFGVGSLATATYAVVPGLVLLYYLTDILGVTAAIASFVVFLPKLLDLVYNPIIGRLSDSTVSRIGPRRPWMIAGMTILPLGFASIFFSPFEGYAAGLVGRRNAGTDRSGLLSFRGPVQRLASRARGEPSRANVDDRMAYGIPGCRAVGGRRGGAPAGRR